MNGEKTMSRNDRLLQTAITTCVLSLCWCLAGADTAGTEKPGADLVAVGPLELVEPSSVTVLGREFKVADTYGLETGTKVAVHGELQTDGSVLNAWVEPVGDYTAGADSVYETGVVTNVNESVGEMTLSGTNVDYTAALAEAGAAAPSVGQTVAVMGTQPVAGGTVLVSTTNATGASAVAMLQSGGGLSSAFQSGGGLSSAFQSGGGIRSSFQSGGGARSSFQSGGGLSSAFQSGGGLSSAFQSGGGLSSAFQSGGGLSSAFQSGGGASSQ
jgi:hypothetical protein